jgi:ribosome assembly protein 1
LYAEKLGVNEKVLQKTLWGDFYLHAKTKRVMKGAQEKAKKPLFVQFVLENIWAVYDAVVIRKVRKVMPLIILECVKFQARYACRVLYVFSCPNCQVHTTL